MSNQPEITRTVAIEHAGEKIIIEVHVHLTPEEIRRVLVPAVSAELAQQMRRSSGVVATTTNRIATTAASDFQIIAN